MSSPETAQSYATHVRRLPALYVAGAVLAALAFLGAIAELVCRPSIAAATLLALAGAAVLALYYGRVNALRVQDRIIRLEERLRLERLLPAELRARAAELTVEQLVALRFASDGELAELVRAVLEERLTERDPIKRRIGSWRADWLRV